MRDKQTFNQLEAHFREQIRGMQIAAKAYDAGADESGHTIAVILEAIVMGTGPVGSLLEQLGLKNGVTYLSTLSPYSPGSDQRYYGLFKRDADHKDIPLCKLEHAAPNQWLTFQDWWQELALDTEGHVFSRKDMVLLAVNQDGTEHPEGLCFEPEKGWLFSEGSQVFLLPRGTVLASVRQIASELLVSLNINTAKRPGTRRKLGAQTACYIGEILYLQVQAVPDPRVTDRKARTWYVEDVKLDGDRRLTMQIIA